MKKTILVFITLIVLIISGLCITNYISYSQKENDKNSKYNDQGFKIVNEDIYNINEAIKDNDIDKVKKLIKGVDLNQLPLEHLSQQKADELGYTAEDVDVTPTVKYENNSPLIEACKQLNYDIVKLLLDNGANPKFGFEYINSNNKWEIQSPVGEVIKSYTKAKNDNRDVLDISMAIIKLVTPEKSILKNKPTSNKITLLLEYHKVKSNEEAKNDFEIFKLLIERGSLIPDDCLLLAAQNSNLLIVKDLIEKYNFDINQTNSSKQTALYLAIENQNVEMVKYLLSKGADKSIKAGGDRTAIDIAKEKGNKQIIDLLTK